MNRPRFFFPLLGVALLWLALAGYVWFTAAQLPERVATHFGAQGQPNGWMSRGSHVQFTLIMGAVVPAFVMGIFAVMGRFPGQALNISHKDYWLAPERRQETLDFVQRQGARFAGLFLGFLAAIHWSILVANRHSPATLSTSHVVWIAGGFLAATVVWVLVFVFHFSRKPA